jgi:hypothetical protein
MLKAEGNSTFKQPRIVIRYKKQKNKWDALTCSSFQRKNAAWGKRKKIFEPKIIRSTDLFWQWQQWRKIGEKKIPHGENRIASKGKKTGLKMPTRNQETLFLRTGKLCGLAWQGQAN